MESKGTAVIFDMDGVVVQNDQYHIKAWEMFCREKGLEEGNERFRLWFGNTNATILQNLFGHELSPDDIRSMAYRKEEIYRDIYADSIQPVPGLMDLLQEIKKNDLRIALATSAPYENVEFVLNHTGTGIYFDIIVDESMISDGKPSPEIFLKAAEMLNLHPSGCIVFEDSFYGIIAANRAGMKVVGVATTHKPEVLKDTIMNIRDFTEMNISIIRNIFSR